MVPIDGLGGAKPTGGPGKPLYPNKPAPSTDTPDPESGEDSAVISDRGLALIGLREIPPTREALVDMLKAAINNGTYNLEGALDDIIDGLTEGPA